ncbi:nucleoporin NUP53-like isoform X2 [Centruroides sculpturatus]|nr:nucleoporin NUP53-like isoform X2 [Centruroides sculpturatus]XP_023230722.1 nucleoporin NUP53-like isoform X2 [Centruroides sculpturatus]
MTLGSPSSPNTPSPSGSSQYLPGYLTGATTPTAPPVSSVWSVRNPAGRSSIPPYVTNLQTNLTPLSKTPILIHSQTPRGKPGVPPVQELFDNITSPASNYPAKNIATPQKSMVQDKMVNATFDSGNLTNSILTPDRNVNQTTNSSFLSPAQIDPFYTQGENLTADMQLDETWVTVFGFPPAAASYILQQFSQYGTVLEHKIATSGNWMHIHYETKLQAKKAIGKNGKIFGKTMMIGVTQCIEKAVMDESCKENSLCSSAISPFISSEKSGMNQGTIRPLTQAYKTAVSTHKVTPQTRTPQKNNNVISKAMEYIFSW